MRNNPIPNEPKAFQNENCPPMAGGKCFECGQMGHFARGLPKQETSSGPSNASEVRMELFCTSCGETGHLDVVCEQFPEPAQDVRKKWDVHRKKLLSEIDEEQKEDAPNPPVIQDKVCMVRAKNSRSCHGQVWYSPAMHVSGAKGRGCSSLLGSICDVAKRPTEKRNRDGDKTTTS